MIHSAIKHLSGNDLGLTKSHQAGLLIPKLFIELGLFDALSKETPNPRIELKFFDVRASETLFFNYIFYNNKFFNGTRNEYRLTKMTKWMHESGLKVGDDLKITRIKKVEYEIEIIKQNRRPSSLTEESWTALYGEVM
jgi:hypothetical protein